MEPERETIRVITRRQFGKAALSVVPAATLLGGWLRPERLLAAIESRISGVRIGAISYSFRALPDARAIVRAMVQMGIGEVELMSNHAEALAGAPGGRRTRTQSWRGAGPRRPQHGQVSDRFPGRGDSSPAALLQHERQADERRSNRIRLRDGEGARRHAMTTSTQVSMAKRVAPFADRTDRRRLSRSCQRDRSRRGRDPQSFATCLSYSKYHAHQSRHRPLHCRRVRCRRVPSGQPRRSRTCT